MHAFSSPSELRAFVLKLAEELERAGMPEDSERLRLVATIAYTTGSEWLGDLGLAVREVQKKHHTPPAIQDALGSVMSAVHVAWPKL